MEELNRISEEDLEEGKKNNVLPDFKRMGDNSGDGSKEYLKDKTGIWTENQIAENPIGYLKYLRDKLDNKLNQNDITKICLEIKRVEETYLSNDYTIRKK